MHPSARMLVAAELLGPTLQLHGRADLSAVRPVLDRIEGMANGDEAHAVLLAKWASGLWLKFGRIGEHDWLTGAQLLHDLRSLVELDVELPTVADTPHARALVAAPTEPALVGLAETQRIEATRGAPLAPAPQPAVTRGDSPSLVAPSNTSHHYGRVPIAAPPQTGMGFNSPVPVAGPPHMDRPHAPVLPVATPPSVGTNAPPASPSNAGEPVVDEQKVQ